MNPSPYPLPPTPTPYPYPLPVPPTLTHQVPPLFRSLSLAFESQLAFGLAPPALMQQFGVDNAPALVIMFNAKEGAVVDGGKVTLSSQVVYSSISAHASSTRLCGNHCSHLFSHLVHTLFTPMPNLYSYLCSHLCFHLCSRLCSHLCSHLFSHLPSHHSAHLCSHFRRWASCSVPRRGR